MSATTAEGTFLDTIETLRRRAREHIEKGAVTSGYQAPLDTVIRLLNEALATEIVCVLRYKRHYYMAEGIHAQAVAAEFLEHANEEQQHADMLAERITQLNGEPNFNPDGLSERSHSEYTEGSNLVATIREDLVAERIAIDSYSQMIRFIGERDPTTRVMLEKILASEEKHAQDLANLLVTLDPTREKS
jgi:bacterioferritin